jgi:death-on-curing protein
VTRSALRFLSVEDVLAIHADTIKVEGGPGGLRDAGLLESAVMMPQQQFDGKFLHPDRAAMAAAYHFHIAQNHAFHDGNKRTAALAALVFLMVNEAPRLPAPDDLERVTLAVAAGTMNKADLTEWFRREIERS